MGLLREPSFALVLVTLFWEPCTVNLKNPGNQKSITTRTCSRSPGPFSSPPPSQDEDTKVKLVMWGPAVGSLTKFYWSRVPGEGERASILNWLPAEYNHEEDTWISLSESIGKILWNLKTLQLASSSGGIDGGAIFSAVSWSKSLLITVLAFWDVTLS